ncbi:MAG TPA: MFS transporter [Solirubrobacterales bacterium]|jgi:EmrB/QacA subfamily drug resistance transporter
MEAATAVRNETRRYPRRWLAAAVMIGAAAMDLIDLTIVNIALPTIRTDLGASGTELEWVISAYMLAFAASLIVAGSFGDLFGRRRIFCGGVAVFGLASLAAGLAQTPEALIAARVVQGTAAAAMIPQLLATFRAIFDGEERGKAFAIYGAALGFASAIGLILGGVLTEADLFGWGWRTVFFVNIPVALLSLPAAIIAVPETSDPEAGRPDLRGAALLAASIVAIAYPLLEGRGLGWPAWTWAMLAAGVGGLVALAMSAERRPRPGIAPLLRTRLLRIPAFSAGLLVQAAFSAGLQGFSVTFVLWIQGGMHFSPLGAGLTLLAFSVGSFLLAPLAVPLAQRYGRATLSLGGLLMAAGVLGTVLGAGHVGNGSDPWPVVPGLLVAGAGLSLMIIPLVNVVLAAVPSEVAGGAGGIFSTSQQLGGALGVALVGAVFFSQLESHAFTEAFKHSAPVVIGLFLAAALLALALPGTAVSEEQMAEL